jgi:hypothetical protein
VTRWTSRKTQCSETRYPARAKRLQIEKKRRKREKKGGERKIIEILGFSCTYGCISHSRNTLEKTYEAKKAKYEKLARMLSTQRHEKARVTVVIVSSMRAIYGPSMKNLQNVLRCNDKEIKKQMSETAILGHWKSGETMRNESNKETEARRRADCGRRSEHGRNKS